jgi:hypothetical protein
MSLATVRDGTSYYNAMMGDLMNQETADNTNGMTVSSRSSNALHKFKPRYRLEKQDDDIGYAPEKRNFSFYQICHFHIDKKHKVRKIIYDEKGEIVSHNETLLKKDILNRFLKKCPKYKYTIYPTYDLDVVGFPDPLEILTAQSHILNEY